MSKANEIQVGGTHYRPSGEDKRQHWDMMYAFNWDYFICAASKYVDRLGRKDADHRELGKTVHYLQKRIELSDNGVRGPGRTCDVDESYYPTDASRFPTTSRAAVVCDLTEWALSRGYSSFQLGFLMLLSAGEYARAVALVESEIAKRTPQAEEPERTYVNPDAGLRKP